MESVRIFLSGRREEYQHCLGRQWCEESPPKHRPWSATTAAHGIFSRSVRPLSWRAMRSLVHDAEGAALYGGAWQPPVAS